MYTVEYTTIRAYGDYSSQIDLAYDPTPQIRGTFNSEFARAHNVLRTYTEFGFNKGRIPKPLFASMQAFFYNNNKFRAKEEWGPGKKGVFVNWWDQDVHMVQMPPALKVSKQSIFSLYSLLRPLMILIMILYDVVFSGTGRHNSKNWSRYGAVRSWS
jgi:hypothetical protein